jgi:hypothetical protein
MWRLAIALTTIVTISCVGSLSGNASILRGNALSTAIRNFTPIEPAACNGTWGRYGCGPGHVRYCRGGRCWCGPC